MAKNIFEELPARKHAPAKAAPAAAKGGDDKGGREGGDGSEKKIRQAVYDIRYRARREGIDLRAAYSQYMQNSNLSAQEQAAVRAKLFGKDGGGAKEVKEERTAADPGMKKRMGQQPPEDQRVKSRMPSKKEMQTQSYDALMTKGATDSVANALFQVFVEKTPDAGYEDQFAEDANSERKYKVRVTDPKSEKSYVRYADRAKITELRQKGLKVEMTEHGDPYEGERKKKGGMDPVAKNPKDRDGDVNNDGKKDSTDKYIYNRRDAINAAIAKKKGEVKEDFLIDGTTSTEGQNKGKITGTGVDNSALITVNPENKADAHGMNKRRGIYAHTETEITASRKRLFEMIAEKKKADACSHNGKGEECGVHGMKACPDTVEEEVKNCGCGKNPCVTYGESKEDKKECTPGERETYRTLLKNKMRAMGIKRPLIMDMEPGEEKTMKAMTSSDAKLAATCEETEQLDEFLGSKAQKAVDTFTKNLQRKLGVRKDKSAETKKETPVTAGGGTPDTQKADKESERLGKNRMRQAGY